MRRSPRERTTRRSGARPCRARPALHPRVRRDAEIDDDTDPAEQLVLQPMSDSQ